MRQALRAAHRRRLAGAHPRARDLAAHLHAGSGRAVGDPPAPQGSRLIGFVAAPAGGAGDAGGSEGKEAVADASRALLDPSADHRLRAALRHLQAGRTCSCDDVERLRRLMQPRDAAGADRLRRQGPPGGRAGQGQLIQRIFQLSRDPALRRAARRSGGLRHQRRRATWSRAWTSGSTTRAGRMEASGTSGMKVVLNGGAELLDPGRLVGRGLRRLQRLRHRRQSPPWQSGAAGRPGPRGALPAARGDRSGPLLRPQSRGHPPGLGGEDEEQHRHPRLALQR